MKFIYPAVFRKKDDGGYQAWFPDLECCEASGETLDDAIENANEACRNWITVELEEEDPLLPYVSDHDDIETEEGDIIRIDIPARKLELLVDEATLEQRRAKVKPHTPKTTSPFLRRYAKLVSSAASGAVFSK